MEEQVKKTPRASEVITIFISFVLIATLLLAGCPVYNVWQSGMEGKAKYNKATYDRQVRVIEARAGYEAALWDKARDTVQGQGIAITNTIIGNSLKDNEAYLYFKWLQTLKDIKGEGQVIYLPGGSFPNLELPITEASRLQKKSVVPTGDHN